MYQIAVILPVYNGIKYLEQSVHSVLNQKSADFELVVIDDCSEDGSWEFLQTLNDDRLTLYRNEKNSGLFFNLNFLIQNTDSTLIKLWSQDDVMEPDCIEEIIKFHKRYPQVGFSYTDRYFIDSKSELLNIGKEDSTPELISPALHADIAFLTGSIAGNIANVTLTRSVVKHVGLFNENMKISGDFEMWVRLAEKHPVGFLKKKMIRLRIHKEQLSGQEKYFIYHLKEDLATYKILLGYLTPEKQEEGRIKLRSTKLLFYYTLMIKAFIKGNFKVAFTFYQHLSSFDKFYLVSLYYIKYKILKVHIVQRKLRIVNLLL